MEWRCEWCEKPHEENDPPCDSCGHGKFERAVVPVGPEGDGNPLVWVCESCGRTHQRNSPPCSRCGHAKLEQREQRFDEDDPLASVREEPATSGSERAADATGDSVTVWACTECDRQHPRNNPPCSRCGHMSFEQREQHFEDIQPSGGGWLDALFSRYGLGLVGAVLLLGIFAAGGAGIIDVPGMATGPPTVEDVPGDESEVGHLDLAEVEQEYVAELNDRRTAADYNELDRSDGLAAQATYANQRSVKAHHEGGDPPDEDELERQLTAPDECSSEVWFFQFSIPEDRFDDQSVTNVDDEAEFASIAVDGYRTALMEAATAEGHDDELVDALIEEHDLPAVAPPPTNQYFEAPNGYVGVDVHIGPDGTVFVTQFVC